MKNAIRTNMFGFWVFGMLVGANAVDFLPVETPSTRLSRSIGRDSRSILHTKANSCQPTSSRNSKPLWTVADWIGAPFGFNVSSWLIRWAGEHHAPLPGGCQSQ